MRSTMRRLGAVAALALGLSLTAACGGESDEPSKEAPANAAGAFPVTIEHKLGTAKIESEPKRIVALGEADQDALLALGVQPVGMAELTGIQDDGLAPWTASKITGEKPKLLKAGEAGFSIEEIAALQPDLILAGGDYYIDQEYEKLSKLAPTVAYTTGPAEDSWQAVTAQTAKAVGREADGGRLIGEVENKIEAVVTSHPGLKDKGFAFTSVFPSGNIGVMKSETDTSVKLLSRFGLVLPDEIKKLPGEGFAAELSIEKAGVLDTDILISHYNDDPATQKKIESSGVFSNLEVVKRGSYVAIDLKAFWPLRTPTALAVPYVVDEVVPQIAEAAKKAAS